MLKSGFCLYKLRLLVCLRIFSPKYSFISKSPSTGFFCSSRTRLSQVPVLWPHVPHVEVLVCLYRFGRGEKANSLSGTSSLKTRPKNCSPLNIIIQFDQKILPLFLLGLHNNFNCPSLGPQHLRLLQKCITEFWFQTINTSSENFQFRCPSLEMLLRCLGPIQNRITELLGRHQTPSPLGNTPKDSDHSTDCHVGRKTIVLLLPVSFQD